jgi:hypothetical protein
VAGDGGDVLEAGVVVQDGRAVVLGDGCGKETENACCPGDAHERPSGSGRPWPRKHQ